MSVITKEIDLTLVRANLKMLRKAFENNNNDLWRDGGTMVGEELTNKYLPYVRVIATEIGLKPLSIIVQFLDGEKLEFVTLQKEKFTQFLDFVDAYCNISEETTQQNVVIKQRKSKTTKNRSNVQSDIILAQKLVTVLVEINKHESNLLWQTNCMSSQLLRSEHEATVLHIIKILGQDLFEEFIDIRGDNTGTSPNMSIRDFKKASFEAFIAVANHEIEIQLGIYEDMTESVPDYNTAWNLLCGMTVLLDTSDQFFAKREDNAVLGQGCDHKVVLENPFRAYLYRIITTAQLQDVVSDVLCDVNADEGEQSFVKLYHICDLIDIDDLCNDLDIIEKLIRSMCKIKSIDKFVFGIDEVIDDSTEVKMTLAKYVRYECEQQLK